LPSWPRRFRKCRIRVVNSDNSEAGYLPWPLQPRGNLALAYHEAGALVVQVPDVTPGSTLFHLKLLNATSHTSLDLAEYPYLGVSTVPQDPEYWLNACTQTAPSGLTPEHVYCRSTDSKQAMSKIWTVHTIHNGIQELRLFLAEDNGWFLLASVV